MYKIVYFISVLPHSVIFNMVSETINFKTIIFYCYVSLFKTVFIKQFD